MLLALQGAGNKAAWGPSPPYSLQGETGHGASKALELLGPSGPVHQAPQPAGTQQELAIKSLEVGLCAAVHAACGPAHLRPPR